MNRKQKSMKDIMKDIKYKLGKFLSGKKNSITDLEGVKVGHLSINRDLLDPSGEKTVIRTGLTAVLPYPMEKEIRLFTGIYNLGAENEVTGYEVIDDFCYLNSPIVITNSFNIGEAYNAILSYGFALKRSEIWPPLVIGIDDSYLNDIRKSRLDEKDILDTLFKASEDRRLEGSVGAGVGLRAFGWKGGIGTASRVFSVSKTSFTCGALVASNHGNQEPLKKPDAHSRSRDGEEDSLIMIIGVDVPLIPYQIKHITKRLVASFPSINSLKNSLDSVVCILFSTANPMSMENDGPFAFDFQVVDDSFLGTVIQAASEAARGAVLNSLLAADPVQGRLGRKVETIPDDEIIKILEKFKTQN
jgi:D-aminopeptidase